MTSFVPSSQEELQAIKDQLKSRFNITIAGGQGHLKGKILRIRIGHIGKGITQFMEVIKHES